ncbi:MAG: DUF4968 domain-containing protein, partial [Bacteroidetes bacterium]
MKPETLRHKPQIHALLLFFLLHLAFCIANGQWQTADKTLESFQTDKGYVFFLEHKKVELTVLSPEIFRIRVSENDLLDHPDNSWAVVKTDWGKQEFEIKNLENVIVVSTSKMEARVILSPLRISFYDKEGKLLNEDDPQKGISWSGNEIVVWKTMPSDEFYFGLGEKSGSLDRKGKSYAFWNSDIPAYKADTDPLYQTIPFFYGIRKGITYGIFFDNTYYSYFNFGKEHQEKYSFGASDGELNYYFIYGPKPKDVLKSYSLLTGAMPLPPKWSLGYQQCRWSYYPESRVREIAQNFRSRSIPCDVIYLDIHYMDAYKCFTWDSTRFPNPKKLTSDLAAEGFNDCYNVE